MINFIIGLFIGYVIGLTSALFQIIRMENKEGKKIQEILERKGE